VKRLRRGAWEVGKNTLSGYEKSARVMADKIQKQARNVSVYPHIYSVLLFTHPPNRLPAPVSFAGGNPARPIPEKGVGACNLEQFPLLLAEFRALQESNIALNPMELSLLADFFLTEMKPHAASQQRRIDDYRIIAEHHVDPFLNCKIYLGEGDLLHDQIWMKEYERIFSSSEERSQKDRLMLRHADVLQRFPDHPHIVNYHSYKLTEHHLYVMLYRKPGVFLSELLSGEPLGQTTIEELQRVPFHLQARLQILGHLLSALEYLTQQRDFTQTAYRDLRPDSIFLQITSSLPVAQLFNFDCTKIPGSHTKVSNIRSGHKRFPLWDDYASPELLEHINLVDRTSEASFTGDVRSDLFSWGVIAWQLLTGELPFADTRAKLANNHNPWPDHLAAPLQSEAALLPQKNVQLLEACLDRSPTRRPPLAILKRSFP
jgi:serine/threonine protein kinase